MTAYTIADYLIERLAGLGLRHLFEVPGNYTAEFLNRINRSNSGIQLVATTNELEAGRAADVTGRLFGLGAVCVTYGVGAQGLYEAIAGAYVERCPVVLINGIARRSKTKSLVEKGVVFAHAIDPLRTDELIFIPITVDRAAIVDAVDAPRQIDRVLAACVTQKRPVYLEVPHGSWLLPCDRPSTSYLPLPTPAEQFDDLAGERVEAAVLRALAKLRAARCPVLWGGEELQRFGVQSYFEELVKLTGFPYSTTLLGKGLISEDNPHFIGVYDSIWAPHDTAHVIAQADCIFALGTIITDFYESIVIGDGFERMVLAAGGAVRIGTDVLPAVDLALFVRRLVEVLRVSPRFYGGKTALPGATEAGRQKIAHDIRVQGSAKSTPEGEKLTWDNFFREIGKDFVTPDMYLLADTSFGLFKAGELLVHQANHFVAQAAWLSIGYTMGAVLGVGMHLKALGSKERVVSFVGDGGFQMLPGAIATLARYQIPATIFVFDNAIYGVEQYLIDKDIPPAFYPPGGASGALGFCELQSWDYVKLAESLGAVGLVAEKVSDLPKIWEQAKANPGPTVVQVKLAKSDLPTEMAPPPTPTIPAAGLQLHHPVPGLAMPKRLGGINPAALN